MFCVLFSCDLEAQATEKIHLPDERKEPSLENQALHVDLTHVDKKILPLRGGSIPYMRSQKLDLRAESSWFD